MKYKYAFISGNDISKKDIERYGCAGLYNKENLRCINCQVDLECQKRLNSYIRMEKL